MGNNVNILRSILIDWKSQMEEAQMFLLNGWSFTEAHVLGKIKSSARKA